MITKKQLGLITYKSEKAYNGFTLFTPTSDPDSTTHLIDMEGRIVHQWKLGGWVRAHMELLPNGNIFGGVYDHSKPFPQYAFCGADLVEMDWDGNVVWKYEDYHADIHDRSRLENGNTMIMHHVDVSEDLQKKVQGGVPGSEKDYGFDTMHSFVLQEISPEGKVIKEMEVYKKLDPELDRITPLGTRGMWPGLNSIEEMPNGDIMCTSYNCSNIYIFDRETGDVKWRWGHGILSFPHDPQVLDNGNILLLDNQRFPTMWMPPDASRIIEVNPKSEEIEWEFRTDNPVDFHNTYGGGVQRLPNGNTLVCQGAKGEFFEVAVDGDIVWEYVNPFFFKNDMLLKRGLNNCVFRCMRYSLDYKGLKGKSLDTGRYEKWNYIYGPKTKAGMGTVPVQATPKSEVNLPEKQGAPSLGKSEESDKVAERFQMLGY